MKTLPVLMALSVVALVGCGGRGAGRPPIVTASAGMVVVSAAPDRGFNYPYILRIPGNVSLAAGPFLLVEPNNTGAVSDDLQVHLEAAKATSSRAIGAFVASRLNLPLLVPVFPRPETDWRIYTHLLDRDAMLMADGPMRRLDLQLIAMVEDARERLAVEGLVVNSRILLTGFSASGAFANRFTALHPDHVQAVASGGVNGLLILPLGSLSEWALPYPLGVADLERVVGTPFDYGRWREVPQFIYMGSEDDNDAVLFDDGYSDDERAVIFATLGERMQPDRWESCQRQYRAAGASVTFRTYPGVGHGTNQSINTEIADFFCESLAVR